jgi:hypothetical protein
MNHSPTTDRGFLAALRRLAETIRFGLCKQNEFEFSAPWNPRRGGC